jgi:hypothetical protein
MTPVRLKLSIMMFLQYFVWGAWWVTVGTYLTQVHNFSAVQVGLISGTTALGCRDLTLLCGHDCGSFFCH